MARALTPFKWARYRRRDSARRPAFLSVEDRGFDFQPLQVPRRELIVPLFLFQHSLPISAVNSWVKYTNDWVNSLLQSAVIDSQEHEITEKSRLCTWKPTIAAEIYIWLGIFIYIGVYGEISVEDHWKTSQLEDQRPEHSIIKFITYDPFQLLHRHLRLFGNIKFTDDDDFPIAFTDNERCNRWRKRPSTKTPMARPIQGFLVASRSSLYRSLQSLLPITTK
ncbi:Uncharacterized protein HZ326_30136 [Fusarium oxysporum f. sp. albedinis]|nr:Uncharacterized protein HZ326_30136 [Fusarium oxysporum f. sp. albedinis]